MRRQTALAGPVFAMLAVLAGAAGAQTYTVFDMPFAAQDLVPKQLTAAGGIVGHATTTTGRARGFLRDAGGGIAVFDVPADGAGTYPRAEFGGTVYGFGYQTPTLTTGFAWTPALGAQPVAIDGAAQTRPTAVNAAGALAGQLLAPGAVLAEGFVLGTDGQVERFGAVDASVVPVALDDAGRVAGSVGDDGFVRLPGTPMARFDPPVTRRGGVVRTQPVGFDASGQVAGTAQNERCAAEFCQVDDVRGFVRHADGSFDVFRAPRSRGTWVRAVNAGGAITGELYDRRQARRRGYVRAPDGRFTVFDVPGMVQTFPTTIDAAGRVAGRCIDAAGQVHGFVRQP